MLMLNRHPGQSIHIGEDIKVTVSKVKGNNVTIGIEAPRDVNIRRDELPPLKDKKSV